MRNTEQNCILIQPRRLHRPHSDQTQILRSTQVLHAPFFLVRPGPCTRAACLFLPGQARALHACYMLLSSWSGQGPARVLHASAVDLNIKKASKANVCYSEPRHLDYAATIVSIIQTINTICFLPIRKLVERFCGQ